MKPLTPNNALRALLLATGDGFAEAVTPTPYQAALELVARIDVHLTLNTAHFYKVDGEIVKTLDEALQAIGDGSITYVPPVSHEQLVEVAGQHYPYCNIDKSPYKNKPKRKSLPVSVRVPKWLVGKKP